MDKKIILPSTNTYEPISEGKHIFKIIDVEYKEDFDLLKIFMENEDGKKHIEKYTFVKSNGEPNDKSLKAFAFLSRIALQNDALEEINPSELVGKYFSAVVSHNVVDSINDPSKKITFIQLTDKSRADGFTAESKKENSKKYDDIDLW